MKYIFEKNKIILIILTVLIVAGLITMFVTGFEKSIEYQAGTRIEVYIPQGYEKQDIINIADESFSAKEIGFKEVEKLNQVAGIKIKEYTTEELETFKTKISEKYDIDEKELEVYEIAIPTTRIRTAVEPYVFPVILVTVLSLIYVLFRNLKSENKWKIILKIVLTLAITLGIYFSLILILQLPFADYTMPLALGIYIITLIILVNNNSNKR